MSRGKAWLGLLVSLLALTALLSAQSGAITGQIEGAVTDPSGAAVAGAKVIVVNLGTGLQREATTEAEGIYRFPLLPLGSYKVTVEAQGFNKYEQTGIDITTGSIATINAQLKVGALSESVVVTGDAPIAEPARVDVGALVNARSVTNLPLVSRNVYNFILLQPNVSAHPNTEFGVPRKINANGFTDRIDYQLDGNNNTQSDRKGIRLLPISQTFIKEVVVSTNGFAPEFGNTTGTVYNAVTNSGTNDWHGSGAYLFRRTDFGARSSLVHAPAAKPITDVDNWLGTVGGPVRRDKLHFFSAYEWVKRNIPSPITVTPANAAALGIPDSELGSRPFNQRVHFVLGRADWQITSKQRFMGRYMYFRNNSPFNPNNTVGNLKVKSSSDVTYVDRAHAAAAQLVSVLTPTVINEVRFQYARRYTTRVGGAALPAGPVITVSGVAAFGGTDDLNAGFTEQDPHLVENLSWIKGSHNFKFGWEGRWILVENRSAVFANYTFPSVAAYLAARSGANPKGYTSYVQTLGNPLLSFDAAFHGFFAQDSWTVNPRLNLTYGLRYDVYRIPQGDAASALNINKDFRVDKNNFSPRFGLAYSLGQDRKTVIRLNGAMFYDTPQTDIYRRSIITNGSARFFNANIAPTASFAPSFPTVFTTPPPVTVPVQDIVGVARDFATLYSFNTNIQVTRELRSDLAVTLGYLFTKGTHIPVTRQINRVVTTGRLADGRPIFSTATADRPFPQYNNVTLHESVGNSNYNGLNLSLNKRFSRGFQVQATYTWSHAIDDAPEENVLDSGNLTLSDPTNRRIERGNGLSDRRHIITISGVLAPTFKLSNTGWNYLLNNNQLSFLINGGSGDVFTITGNRDLTNNPQATVVTRPLFIGRNTVRGQAIAQFDMRYSRFIPFKSDRYRAEILAEFTNLFNHTNVTGYNTSVPVDTAGNIILPTPVTFLRASATRDPRLFQLGFKFIF